jgi:hypothetical protein
MYSQERVFLSSSSVIGEATQILVKPFSLPFGHPYSGGRLERRAHCLYKTIDRRVQDNSDAEIEGQPACWKVTLQSCPDMLNSQ